MRELFDELKRRGRREERISRKDVLKLVPAIQAQTDTHGRATPELRAALLQLESAAADSFSPGAKAMFQQAVASAGAQMKGSILLPEDDTPYWQLNAHPLAGFQSSAHLPETVDIAVIGAGLTGASAAWSFAADLRRKGLRVIVLDQGEPATAASGRNGGNFELIPENFLGQYEGLPMERRKWLARRYPWLPSQALRNAADMQARLIFEFGARNSARFLKIVRDGNIDCDLSETGWVRIADSRVEERGIRNEVEFAAKLGIHFEVLSPAEIRRELEIPTKFAGRKAVPNGNYHPFKFVCGVLQRAIDRGVGLFTRTPVERLIPRGDRTRLETPRGRVDARRVIFATNAFTAGLLPELRAIRYYQSQILNLEHVRDTIRGMTVTEKKGDLYYNFPRARQYTDANGVRRGMLLVGGGLDRPGRTPSLLRRSQSIMSLVLAQAGDRFKETRGQPPSRTWTGPMAFTPDRVPVIGFLRKPGFAPDGLIVAAGFNGYGGTYCVEAGRLAAEMALSGNTPPEIPEAMFSPHRFLTRRPLFGDEE